MLRIHFSKYGRVSRLSIAAFVLLIFAIYFAKGGMAPGLAVSPVIGGALLAFVSGTATEMLRRHLWFWLFLGFMVIWLAVGAVFGNAQHKLSDASNIALLGALFLFAAQTSRVLSTRQILWIIAGFGAASAFLSIILHVLTVSHPLNRMIPLGRGGNPIPGAGALAVALVATAALWKEQGIRRGREFAIVLVLAIPLAAGMLWTQSRGPLVAVSLALPMAFLLERRGMAAVLAACFATWLTVTGLIFFEPTIKAMICSDNGAWCRPSNRNLVWDWVRDQIALHPVLGNGPGFRFPHHWLGHAHNGLFGVALHFGPLVLAVAGCAIAGYVRILTRATNDMLRFFGLAMLIFSFGYMGADLSNPFAFYNTHYLFLWFPILLVLACDGQPSGAEMTRAAPAPAGARHM